MADVGRSSGTIDQAVNDAGSWIERLARLGYASRGLLYIIVGGLAVALAFGDGGSTTDSRGALERIADKPLGTVALAVMALGLAGYAVWRLSEAIANPERLGADVKGIAKRVGHLVRAIVYGALAWAAARMAFGDSSGSSGSQQTDSLTARAMALPMGRWLVGIGGAITIGYGLYRLWKAFGGDVEKHLRLHEASPDARQWMLRVSRFGIAARGIVLALIGWFFVQAALQSDASEAGGVAEALDTVAGASYGPWLLGAVALGLVAFGVHSFIQARYRRIDVG